MELVIFLDITIILMIGFILSRKTLHIFENIFLFIVTDILFLNYMAVSYNNTDLFELLSIIGMTLMLIIIGILKNTLNALFEKRIYYPTCLFIYMKNGT
ncbi:hypothetical protein PB1_11834 [Bacillus methanolicus PB1]|uniref:Uncharacterized protein n=1 Tax=Bacillus methanolicus PB1 TaxID=997296 RepID=I3DVH8_BACMT|nr:hypothetical protein PB1_11834 [Bacillus methanolicus PB1]